MARHVNVVANANQYSHSTLAGRDFGSGPLFLRDMNTAVEWDDGAVDVAGGGGCEEEGESGHVFGGADSSQRAAAFDLLAEVVERPGHHFALEGAGGNRVARNAASGEAHGKHFGEVVDGGFGRAVGEIVDLGYVEAVDGADVNDARGVVGAVSVFEQRHERLGEEEDSFDVDVESAVVTVFGEFVEGFAPGGAGVIDEDIDGVFIGFDFVGEMFPAFFDREIGGHGNALTDFGKFCGNRVADVGFAGGDVDLRAVLHVARGDHESDAARPASDDGNFAFNAEKSGDGQVWGFHGAVLR